MYDKKCPMMCPMKTQHHIMPYYMPEIEAGPEMVHYEEDEKDENYFAEMYPDVCKKMMPYIDMKLDEMEEKDEMLYEGYPDAKLMKNAADEAYDRMMKEMPDMMHHYDDSRQYGYRNPVRDVFGILLLNELLRRRRRRRRFYSPGYYGDYGYYGVPFNYGDYYYDWD
ncbi:MAG: hypothetical protein ACOZCL_13815 [Bacillota bacterium]